MTAPITAAAMCARASPRPTIRRARACEFRSAARRAVELRGAAGICLGARLAGRRSRAVGQSLHHAPARRLRPERAAHHAPHPGQGRSTAIVNMRWTMTAAKKKSSRLTEALLETAEDMRRIGLLDRAT